LRQKARLLLWFTWGETEAAIRSLPAGSQDEEESLSAQAVAHQKLANAAIFVQGASLGWPLDDLSALQTLWDDLAEGRFDWARFLEHHKMTGEEPLSEDFITQIQPLCLTTGLSEAALMTKLQDACEFTRAAFIEIGSMEKKLEIIYRSRSSYSPKRAKSAPAKVDAPQAEPVIEEAISDSEIQPARPTTPNLAGADLQALTSQLTTGQSPKRKADVEEGDVIGTEVFHYNGAELEAYVKHVSRFWRSEREPEGVPIEDV
jgi:hypothetical protein